MHAKSQLLFKNDAAPYILKLYGKILHSSFPAW